ncbi:hypothetical protein [Pseudogemmobacter blasticus]|uniref:hypothetical protein n=1 Tax=Fuscovulum blasticum TaxID=1075 RepID=UPI0011B20DCB|nr:hypothetical protein [Fuscovulum blasticum]
MKLVAAAIVLLIGWQAYQLGYRSGQRSSADYAAAIAEKARSWENERIKSLEAMLAAFPSKEQCVPIMLDQQIDEYAFCKELLSESQNRDTEWQDDREQDWGR